MNKATNCALVLIALAMSGAAVSYHFTLESRFATLEQKLDQNAVALQQCQISEETTASSKTEAVTELSKQVDTLQSSLGPLGKATVEQNASLAEIRKQIATIQQSQQAQQETQKNISDYSGQLEKIKHDIVSSVVQTPTPVPNPAPAPAPAVVGTPAPAPVIAAKPAPAPVVETKPAVVSPTPVAEVKPAAVIAPPPGAVPLAKPVTSETTQAPVASPVVYPVALPVSHRASAVDAPLPVAPRADNAVDLRPDDTVRTVSITPSPRAQPVQFSENR